MHLELNHSSAGVWSYPVDIDSRKPEIRANFLSKNAGKYYSINGLDASQGNYALADLSFVQGTDVDLSCAIEVPLITMRPAYREKTLLCYAPTPQDNTLNRTRPSPRTNKAASLSGGAVLFNPQIFAQKSPSRRRGGE